MLTLHIYRRLFVIVLFCQSWAYLSAAVEQESVTYQVHWINKTRVHVVTVDLNDRELLVTPVLANGTPGARKSFTAFLAERQPLAQISGSYFSVKTAQPIGDMVIAGKMVYLGHAGSALTIKPDNTAAIVNIPYKKNISWKGYESVLQGGVRLVQNGKFAVYPKEQGFKDPGIFRKATRTAVGITDQNKLLLVAVNKEIFLSELAGILKALGCRDAMSLDGGTSTGLAVGLDIIFTPGRMLSNVLMVVRRPPPPTETTAAVDAGS